MKKVIDWLQESYYGSLLIKEGLLLLCVLLSVYLRIDNPEQNFKILFILMLIALFWSIAMDINYIVKDRSDKC